MKTQYFKKNYGGSRWRSGCARRWRFTRSSAAVAAAAGGGFGGFGGFGGGGGGGAARSSSSSTAGQYNNNGTVGNAVISVDPVTHNIVVIADEETSQQISNVIANLDVPEPQVLIKVVFVEVHRQQGVRHRRAGRLYRIQS